MELVAISGYNRPQINDFMQTQWLSTNMVVRGELVDMTAADGTIAYRDNKLVGLLTYRYAGKTMEILSLDSLLPRQLVLS